MGEKRISVGIRQSHHKQLGELAEALPSVISKLVDKAIEEFLQTRGQVYRRALEEGERAARKKPRGI